MRKNNKKTEKTKTTDYIAIILLCLFAVNFISYKTAEASTINVPTNFLTLNTGLVGWWTFDGKDTVWTSSTAATTLDKSVSGNTGTLFNMKQTASIIPGKTGQDLLFNGANTYVGATQTSTLSKNNDFTISMWVKNTGGDGYRGGLINNTQATDDRVVIDFNNGAVRARVWNGSVYNSVASGSITPNVWSHIVYIHNSNQTGSLYINGILQSGVLSSDSSVGSFLQIGKVFSGHYFNGLIDDVRIYNRALSATEIQQLYSATSGSRQNVSNVGSDSLKQGLVGWWTFDGKDTVWTSSTAATTLDKSGNGNTGTLTSMNQSTATVAGKVGQGLKFDGVDDYVNVSQSSVLAKNNDFTISMWVKNTGGDAYRGGIINNTVATDDRVVIDFNSGAVRARVWNGSVYNSIASGSISPNAWSQIVYIHNSSQTGSLYINGILQSGVLSADSASGSSLIIGHMFNSYYFKGLIDDVRIYSRVLSATEIQQLYNLGR